VVNIIQVNDHCARRGYKSYQQAYYVNLKGE
jgi:hypothetical protein